MWNLLYDCRKITVTMNNTTLPSKVYELLKQVLNEDIKNFSINVQDPNKKGEGYLGEMCYISLQNKNNGKSYDLIVKQAFSSEFIRKVNPIREVFLNEIYFYTKVWPCFKKFQVTIPSSKAFNKIVKCFGATTEEGFEKLVLENMKFKNFITVDKTKTFDREHMEYIFKEYGKYHALSFAYRVLNPEEYLELSKGFKDIYLHFTETESFRQIIKITHEMCLKSLRPGEDDEVIQKYKFYLENGVKAFADSNSYTGKYSVLLHGDCWSNNMLFKYDGEGKLSDMKFLDFQLIKEGNPVSDLAYCFYSGGSKEMFDQLEHYLRVYHNSLLEAVGEFGINDENLYPFEVLKNDWKQYSQLGITMALLVWKIKLTYENEVTDLTDLKNEDDLDPEKFAVVNYDETAFKKITRDIILHLYEKDFLIN